MSGSTAAKVKAALAAVGAAARRLLVAPAPTTSTSSSSSSSTAASVSPATPKMRTADMTPSAPDSGSTLNWACTRTLPAADWSDKATKAEFTRSVHSAWASSATAAGYTPVKGSKPTETIAPLWRDAAGKLVEVSTGAAPDAYALRLSGPVR